MHFQNHCMSLPSCCLWRFSFHPCSGDMRNNDWWNLPVPCCPEKQTHHPSARTSLYLPLEPLEDIKHQPCKTSMLHRIQEHQNCPCFVFGLTMLYHACHRLFWSESPRRVKVFGSGTKSQRDAPSAKFWRFWIFTMSIQQTENVYKATTVRGKTCSKLIQNLQSNLRPAECWSYKPSKTNWDDSYGMEQTVTWHA